MEIIDLDLDDENEITFKVQIEGTRPGEPLCRLMIEGNNMTHTIIGDFKENNEVVITIPSMKSIINEGKYNSYLEVLVDDRVFIPLEMQFSFENSVKVVAESVTRKRKNNIVASATFVNSSKTKIKPSKQKKEVLKEKFKHPAKKQKTESKDDIYSENDIVNLVEKIRKSIRKQ